MDNSSYKSARIHSLDSLRAVMMLLGLVLHSTEIYLVQDNAPWPKDPLATHIFLDYLEYLIHMFRMPIFFFMAGFFGALLFYERKPVKMIRNRIARIVYPFIVFLFILAPMIVFSLHYSHAVFAGNEDALHAAMTKFSGFDAILPGSTYHLWFLYYLIFITFVSVLLASLLKKLPGITRRITQFFNWIMQKPILRVLFFAFLHFIVLLMIWDLSGGTPLGFKPEFKPFLFYFFFYITGWVLFKSKHLLATMTRYDWLFTMLGIALFTIRFIMSDAIDDVTKGLMHAFIVWLFVFGITGLFVRYTARPSKRMRYISDSSYWVYLIHVPFTILIPGLIAGWMLPAVIKFLITLSITTFICFITYHYFVRATFIGKFLNGRKYHLKKKTQRSVNK